MLARLLAAVAVGLATCSMAWAQEASPDTAAEFKAKYNQWKELLGEFAQIRTRYQTDASADKAALQAEAEKIMNQARDLLEPLTVLGTKAFVAAPNQDPELTAFLVGSINGFVASDDFEIAAKVAKTMVDNQCTDAQVAYLAGIALFMTNDYEGAEKYLQAAKDQKVITDVGLRNLAMIPKYRDKWKREQELRSAEQKAGNLPRVKLTTSKGDIVVELFENEAPNTTANFISLVEKKFYDGLAFHRVIPGFMAQGGDPKGNGSGGPGYTIPDECNQQNHREHFRGSLSMAKTSAPDTGGSQFFITFTPTAHLDGKHTVFGRVVEGMRVLSKLQRTEGIPNAEPDKIIEAKVLNKRPHPYTPIKRDDKG